jgi:hypothetical protein
MSNFKCTVHPRDKKATGFQITFTNGNTVSVQWGEGTYSEWGEGTYSSSDGIRRQHVEEAITVEIAAYADVDMPWHAFPDGDTAAGWRTPEEVLEFMTFAANNTLIPRKETD